MSTHAQRVLKSARSLPIEEQLEVLQGLAESLGKSVSPLTTLSATFWTSPTLAQLVDEQRPPVIEDVSELAMPGTPDDGSASQMIDYLYQQRQADSEL